MLLYLMSNVLMRPFTLLTRPVARPLGEPLEALDPDVAVLAHLAEDLDELPAHAASLAQDLRRRHVALQVIVVVPGRGVKGQVFCFYFSGSVVSTFILR